MKPDKLTPKRDLKQRRAEFEKAMNTPRVNPRYGGMTPIEFLKWTYSIEQNQILNTESVKVAVT